MWNSVGLNTDHKIRGIEPKSVIKPIGIFIVLQLQFRISHMYGLTTFHSFVPSIFSRVPFCFSIICIFIFNRRRLQFNCYFG